MADQEGSKTEEDLAILEADPKVTLEEDHKAILEVDLREILEAGLRVISGTDNKKG